MHTLTQSEPGELRSWISSDYFSVAEHETVETAIERIRLLAQRFERAPAYIYVCDAQGKLTGVLRMRSLLVHDPKILVREMMQRSIVSLPNDACQAEALRIFRNYSFVAIPVVDRDRHLVGVIRRKQVQNQLGLARVQDLYRMVPISQEEVEGRRIAQIVLRRLPWLSITVVTGLMCAYILGIFIGPIESIVAFVFFLPVVLGFSGSLGAQSAAITTRGLEEGNLNPIHVGSMLGKAFGIGAALGGLSCGMAFLIALLWRKGPAMGFVLGSSIFVGTATSAFLGVILPIVFRALRIGSSPTSGLFLLLICDIVAAVLYFTIAIAFMGPTLRLL